MYVNFVGRNGNALYRKALDTVIHQGEPVAPRGKKTLEVQGITTVLEPRERILTVPGRALNPFFNVAENLAILAGLENQRDWFLQFNKQYVTVAHDEPEDEASWAFYGTRLRRWTNPLSAGTLQVDQLKAITKKLEADKFSRQAVATLWHPFLDNIPGHKDYPCNWGVMFKIRDNIIANTVSHGLLTKTALHMTVVNRSNDIHWGLYGVNLSQFSFIQEVLAAILGVEVGHQIHVSDSLHLYLDPPHSDITRDMLNYSEAFDIYEYTRPTPMFSSQQYWQLIDESLNRFFTDWGKVWGGSATWPGALNGWPYLDDAWHFLMAYKHRKNIDSALGFLTAVADNALWASGVEYLLRKNSGAVVPATINQQVRERFPIDPIKVMRYIWNANIANGTQRDTGTTLEELNVG